MVSLTRHASLRHAGAIAGLIGCLLVIIGIGFSSYNFKAGGYSPQNHFISELGKTSAGSFSKVFNLCIMGSGVFLTIFTYGLGRSLWSYKAARYATIVGIISTLSFSMVGYYNADAWTEHKIAAIVFFTGAMFSIAIFGYVIWKNKPGKWAPFIGIQSAIIVLIYLLLLFWPKDLMVYAIQYPQQFIRPTYWDLTILEWVYSACICVWITTTSLHQLDLSSRKKHPF
jgi:hypothetical membrane protein